MKNRIRDMLKIAAPLLVSSLIAPCSFSQNVEKANRVEHVFTVLFNDSIEVEVKRRYDSEGLPDYYYCHVNTPVCEEGLCKLMVIDVYWDVLGNFLKYETPPNEPLTKFDHHEFTDADHAKLRAILADRASILRDYPFEDLVDNRMIRKSDVVDAVSAATRVGVKDAIVSGAVYSTYALWHIVNGSIATKIEALTMPLMDDALLMKMFKSDNIHYQYYALTHFPAEKIAQYLPQVVRLVTNGVSYVPYFAIEKLPDSVWNISRYQTQLLKHFGKDDFELQNGILNKIADVALSTEALDLLVTGMPYLKEKQLIKAFEVVRNSQDRLSKSSRSKLAAFKTHDSQEVSQEARLLVEATSN